MYFILGFIIIKTPLRIIYSDVICIQRLCWPFLSKLSIIKYPEFAPFCFQHYELCFVF
ncbi:hypothetical protein RchiOBHm_Chr7g0230821 [Rosa chinensis]|uniref:Uncharacterized protein n=1 Tax=Rosa chinensis TaxID=74649 RepID=A0A2P6PFH2_ROSCH|nr:hypothetical protein RchiOBHm_Chr7g0230821 [Rosa chinensis]